MCVLVLDHLTSFLFPPFLIVTFAGAGPYEAPPCSSGEQAVQISGVSGDYCAPKCTGTTCPAAPTGDAKAECVVEVGGVRRHTTMVPDGEGGLRLFLHDQLRRAASADEGERVAVRVTLDEAPVEPWPDDLWAVAAAIDGGAQALELAVDRAQRIRQAQGAGASLELR